MQDMLSGERNSYDRYVHFMFGFLLAYPMRELFLRVAKVEGFWGFFFPFDLTVSLSGIFEIVEWFVASLVSDDTSAAYLGMPSPMLAPSVTSGAPCQ
jgi:putative membrane protein